MNKMKERPILFQTDMVQAILDGRKRITRRIVKPQPDDDDNMVLGMYHPIMVDRLGEEYPGPERFGLSNEYYSIPCPYGPPGDGLWVRETWAWRMDKSRIYYRADENFAAEFNRLDDKWRPSIFMPKHACRLRLKLCEVRVERLWDITEEDAKAEGVVPGMLLEEITDEDATYREGFFLKWISINGYDSYKSNPYVWVLKFIYENN